LELLLSLVFVFQKRLPPFREVEDVTPETPQKRQQAQGYFLASR